MIDIEKRAFHVEGLEIRAAADGEDGLGTLVGHAAVFESLSHDLGGFREKVARGAFAESIQQDDVVALVNHDSNLVLGRNKARTLELREDNTGLAMQIRLPDTSAARDLKVSVERRDITGASFQFQTLSDTWENIDEEDGRKTIRTLNKVRLWDVSPATLPAYPATDIAMRAFEAFTTEQRAAAEADAQRTIDWLAARQRQAAASF